MKTITEIFELMIIDITENKRDGLCSTIAHLESDGIINLTEHELMIRFIYSIKPRTGRVKNDLAWWWKPYNKPLRLNWMKRQIEKIKVGKLQNNLK